MKLIASLTSPFARKIRILLMEKAIPCELVVDIPWSADTRTPDYNPLGKVPVLLPDDGPPLFDSRVIAEYLDLVAGPAFFPPIPGPVSKCAVWKPWPTASPMRRRRFLWSGGVRKP